MSKKLWTILVPMLILFSISSLLFKTKDASALCTDFSMKKPNNQPVSGIVNTDVVNPDIVITPMCAESLPMGWSTIRSGSTYVRTTSSGTRIYNRSGGSARARDDFFNVVAPNYTWRKYVTVNGVTFVKSPPQGDVRYYISSSGGEPTLNFGKDKIRYP